MPIFRTKDEYIFQRWSSQMAYALGFITADGSLSKNKRGAHFLEIQSVDREIIYKIREVFKSNLAVGEYQLKGRGYKKRYRLQIESKKVFRDLGALGITPRKSKVVELPDIPAAFFSHFLRGYFDGDGCVNFCRYVQKGRRKPTIFLNCGFTSGSRKILSSIHKKLKKLGVVHGGTLHYHDRAHRLWFANRDSASLYRFMYRGIKDELFLSRKKQVFEKYLIPNGPLEQPGVLVSLSRRRSRVQIPYGPPVGSLRR